jgi:hypothetical protein
MPGWEQYSVSNAGSLSLYQNLQEEKQVVGPPSSGTTTHVGAEGPSVVPLHCDPAQVVWVAF